MFSDLSRKTLRIFCIFLKDSKHNTMIIMYDLDTSKESLEIRNGIECDPQMMDKDITGNSKVHKREGVNPKTEPSTHGGFA